MAPVSRDDAWLWRNAALSDVTLLVYPAGDGPDGAWTSGKPEPLAKLPLHSVVLASISPGYYRGHILRLWQAKEQESVAPAQLAAGPAAASDSGSSAPAGDAEPPQGLARERRSAEEQPEAKRARLASPEAAFKALELVCFPGEPEAVPEAVLHHAYTGILPDEAHLLAWMMWRADYLDMLATVEACLAKLQAMADGGQLTVQDLAVIDSLPALQKKKKKKERRLA